MKTPTISIGYVIKDNIDFLFESYKSVNLIADEFIFVINETTNKDAIIALTNLQQGDDRIHIFINHHENDIKQRDFMFKQCTKNYVLFMETDEVISDNAILLRDIIQNNPDVEAFSLKLIYYIYSLSYQIDGNETIMLKLIKNKQEIIFDKYSKFNTKGFVEPVFVIKEVVIHNYSFVKNLIHILNMYLTEISNVNTSKEIFKSFVWGNYPSKMFDIREQPQPIKDKFRFGEFFK